MVSALCAPSMLSSESAVETLLRNSPSGLFESTFPEERFSTCPRYFLASAVSPDLIADIRLVNALSKEFALLVEPEVDDVEEVESSESRELVLCKLEMDMRQSLSHRFLKNPAAAKQRFSEISTVTAIQCDMSTRGVTGGRANSIMESDVSAVLKWEAVIQPAAKGKSPASLGGIGIFFPHLFGAE